MKDFSPLSSSHCRITRSPWSTGEVPTPDAEARDDAGIELPVQLALEVVGVEALRAEVGVDARAVRDGVGEAKLAAGGGCRGRALPGDALPQYAAALRVERQHLEGVPAVGAHRRDERTPCPPSCA